MVFKGERLAELRKDKNMTQADLAAILHINKNQLSDYERDVHSPPDHIKIELAKIFDISLDYLMGLTDIECTYKKGKESLIVPRNLPSSVIADIQNYIDYACDAVKHRSEKK